MHVFMQGHKYLFEYQKALKRTFHTIFFLQINFCELTRTQIQKVILNSKNGLNIPLEDL